LDSGKALVELCAGATRLWHGDFRAALWAKSECATIIGESFALSRFLLREILSEIAPRLHQVNGAYLWTYYSQTSTYTRGAKHVQLLLLTLGLLGLLMCRRTENTAFGQVALRKLQGVWKEKLSRSYFRLLIVRRSNCQFARFQLARASPLHRDAGATWAQRRRYRNRSY
jgi:hypothetical protein